MQIENLKDAETEMALVLVIQITYSLLWLAIWFVEKLLTDRLTDYISDNDHSSALKFGVIFFNLCEIVLEAGLYVCFIWVIKELGKFLSAIKIQA